MNDRKLEFTILTVNSFINIVYAILESLITLLMNVASFNKHKIISLTLYLALLFLKLTSS